MEPPPREPRSQSPARPALLGSGRSDVLAVDEDCVGFRKVRRLLAVFFCRG